MSDLDNRQSESTAGEDMPPFVTGAPKPKQSNELDGQIVDDIDAFETSILRRRLPNLRLAEAVAQNSPHLAETIHHETYVEPNANWDLICKSVHTVDNYTAQLISHISERLFDKVAIALIVTKFWAFVGLKITRIFEAIFKLILLMPDKSLMIPASVLTAPYTTNGSVIKIITAYTTDKTRLIDCTNKFKLFLKFYWDKYNKESTHSTSGFDFADLKRMLNCSVLYCGYMLVNNDGSVTPEQFWDNYHTFMIGSNGNRITKTSNGQTRNLLLGHVDFEKDAPQAATMTMDALLRSMVDRAGN